MADIKPALTAEEWADRWAPDNCMALDLGAHVVPPRGLSVNGYFAGDRLAGLIALANAALPDGDPRKLTWDMVREIRVVAMALDLGGLTGMSGGGATLNAVAAAIASYLPPE